MNASNTNTNNKTFLSKISFEWYYGKIKQHLLLLFVLYIFCYISLPLIAEHFNLKNI